MPVDRSMSCPFANALGIPGKGIHKTRILGLALNDILMTIAGAAIIAYFCRISFLGTLLILLILGEVLHYVAGTQTAFLTMIGVDASCRSSPKVNTT